MQVSDEEATQPADEPSLSPAQVRLILISLMTAMGLASLDGTIVNTALLTIVSDLGGLRHYAWVGTSYLLTSTISTMLLGKLSDLFGRRRFFLLSMLVFLVGSALCGLATSMLQLILARGLQGIGGGGLISLTFAITGDLVSPRERGKLSSLFTSVFAVSSVVGPLLGGLIVQNTSWRWIFWVNVPIGIAAFALAWKVMHVPFERRDRPIDYFGAGLLTGGISCILLGVAWAPGEYGWSGPTTIGLLAVGVVVTCGFVLWETRAAEPIIPLRVFGIPAIRSMLIAAGTISTIMYVSNAFLPLFLQAVTGVSPTNSGLLLAPMVVGILVAAAITGRLIQRTGTYRRYSVFGFLMAVPAVAGLAQMGLGTTRLAVLLGSMGLLGLACGVTNPISTIAIQNAVPPADIGVASSLAMFIRTLVATIGIGVFGSVLSKQLDDRIDPELLQQPKEIRALPEPLRSEALSAMSESIQTIFIWCVPLAVLGLIAVFVTRELPLRTDARVGRSGQGDPEAPPASAFVH